MQQYLKKVMDSIFLAEKCQKEVFQVDNILSSGRDEFQAFLVKRFSCLCDGKEFYID